MKHSRFKVDDNVFIIDYRFCPVRQFHLECSVIKVIKTIQGYEYDVLPVDLDMKSSRLSRRRLESELFETID